MTPSSQASTSSAPTIARALLFLGGLAAVAWLVWSAGPAHVAAALVLAGPWFPLVVALELTTVLTDAWAVRALVSGPRAEIDRTTWLRSAVLSYASSVVLPAGRAAGEGVRTAVLAERVGLARAASACSLLQIAFLYGNTASSLAAAAVVAHAERAARSWGDTMLVRGLLVNALATASLGTLLLLMVRSARVASLLRRKLGRLVSAFPAAAEGTHANHPLAATALAACCVGRAVQTVQYAVVLHAIGGRATVEAAFVTQGVHLVGALVGDFIPGQMGAMEATYRAFAGMLGVSAAAALSIAFVVRLAQLAIAAAFFVVGAWATRSRRGTSEFLAPP